MDLSTKYLGMNLRTPLVASASPISENIDNIKKLEESGVSAVVLYSLFEEQVRHEQKEMHFFTTQGTENYAEATSFFPGWDDYRLGPEEYLNHITKAKEAVNIPIIASLNGSSAGGWTSYAKKIQQAGADALELNIYYIPTALDLDGQKVEQTYIDILKAVKAEVNIPVAVKLSPFFSNTASIAKKLDDTGANGLVLFNRFYQPDINLDELEVEPRVSLSHSGTSRVAMRWIAILKDRVKADLAATSGIHTAADALKMLLVGANVTQLCSVILKNGFSVIKQIETEMTDWLNKKEYESVQQLQGSMSQIKVADPSAYERANYMKALSSYNFVP